MPAHRGKYVNGCEIAKLVKKVYVGDKTESYERSQFIQHYSENRAVRDIFKQISAKINTDIAFAQQRNNDRTQCRNMLRMIWLKAKNNAIAIGEMRQKQRDEGQQVEYIMAETRTCKEILAAQP